VNADRLFRLCYVRAILVAAAAFGVVHGTLLLAVGFIRARSLKIDPTGFLVLVPYELLQAMVFAIVGGLIALLPARMLFGLLSHRRAPLVRIAAGAVIGVMFTPLCAAVPNLIFRLSDDPSYLSRCFEFFAPMTVAGTVGGYVFGRSERSLTGGRSVADEFS
jgi:hypothetical protein